MDLVSTIMDLIRIKSVTGDKEEVEKVVNYCKNLFKNTNAIVKVFEYENTPPVLFIANKDVKEYDVMSLGHLDVVPAPDDMFEPYIKDGKLYGRGSLDMKSWAVVAFKTMMHVLENNLDLSYAIVLSTDEEKGGYGSEAFVEKENIDAKIVLDNDVGGDITSIVSKCKNPVFVRIIAKGYEAHGSTPWDGIDANERLIQTLSRLRKHYKYFSKDGNKPENTWIDTMHVAKINGGVADNVISGYAEATIDFRLTETSKLEDLEKLLSSILVEGVTYEIEATSVPVVMDEDNPYIVDYKNFAENILEREIKFEQIGGATDSRLYANKGSTVIMHSGDGEGMHTVGEYVKVDSVNKISDIQIRFLDKLAS
jgi:succinyl-diaminopimelate desuccinylase